MKFLATVVLAAALAAGVVAPVLLSTPALADCRTGQRK